MEPDQATLRRARFVVTYLGTSFRGFAANVGQRTVMGELTDAVSRIARRPVELTGAGRTDAGVHAWGQVVSGDVPAELDLGDVARRVNRLCAPEIAIRSAEWAAPDFDARFSATWRRYRYHIWNDPAPNPLVATIVWHVHQPLDVRLMGEAVAPLIGEHDFSSFCRRPKVPEGAEPASMVRIVHDIALTRIDRSPMLRLEITGSAFCQQMVRSITGTLVDVGTHRLSPADVHAIVHAKDRSVAGQIAPPQGLMLWAVGYDGTRWDTTGPGDPDTPATA
jgi:tRNA pseudouridine38-40 synthase